MQTCHIVQAHLFQLPHLLIELFHSALAGLQLASQLIEISGPLSDHIGMKCAIKLEQKMLAI